ncbi:MULTISPECIES: UDP-N-acetylmuramate--L-alanine ligase [Nocardiopsis]|uniref:UDP-N-acetylmuramate--L-alanine ligase n=1 Tax=Nocardiopsis dassonvillei (strain ATCC 23218 / DSM 43111 / CIP 107115 / JCM 7437 / KCTC 9190 / NBRC 14626 / NCTC 10488 / NRRL B-5397 / IMRU 509) TaxID=446468 RepID=D7B0D5_NOCDD|nr:MULTISPECIES: UDP-N-acetylmuramate--L-alanine ligase [Nocardiopsis]ADH66342.1 UDP-N-acetylmuramate/alanine ligase [Nocardiopsis dassonvillei subsp. dassonvillei DSM 43111]APC34663.1 UDP-N-acetylmuramate--L-alanine ligase [Nocardiopsis dassonvillei]NKY79979.1 UDP-N-acetylmuramate--L-alanine ligase [Nocardiopsis dassonvillei]VEI92363.1 UDP-N-acetylmuramate--L-alanine ligase [Nocardiopsis dassonvillei]
MSLVRPTEPVPVDKLGRTHFIGLGGAGMSGIARVLLQSGVEVSGSDARDSDTLRELEQMGADVHVGHAADNLGTAETLVVSSAIREDNPELVEARRRGLRVLPRAAALGALLLGREGVAVSGTHGKTTTTSMVAVVLQHVGADPGYVIGGKLVTTGLGADAGIGEVIAVEADESDGSFLMLSPKIAVVTNVEADHLDNYSGIEEIHANFASFVDRVERTLVVGVDDPGARRVAELARERGKRVLTYGEAEDADYRVTRVRARGFTTEFTIRTANGEPVDGQLAVPGRHNVLNAAAAVAVADELGHDLEVAVEGIADFAGAARRFEPKGEAGGVAVYDSYAHHPTEIEADLRATRAALESLAEEAREDGREHAGGRVVALFQPHLYSRTRIFAEEFAAALGLADEVVVTEVYAAREDPEPGVTAELITSRVAHDRVWYVPGRDDAVLRVAELAGPGDIVLTMGAGDVTELGPRIVEALAQRADGLGG